MVNMEFESFPLLISERLTLRQLTINDHQDIFYLRSNPEINKYLDRQPCKTSEDAINFINAINNNIENRSAFYWAITLTSSKTFVGTICLFDLSNEKSSCEIGYELMTKYQGQGIMYEAAQVVIDYVFQQLRFNNIIACTHCNNQHSIKLLTKLNFTKSNQTDQSDPLSVVFQNNKKLS